MIFSHVNLVMVLALAQDKLDTRNYSGCMGERKEKHVLPEISLVMLELDQWANEWKHQCPQLFTTKSMGPRRFLQNAQQYVTLYIMVRSIICGIIILLLLIFFLSPGLV
jgi:hypothetical protein